MPQVFIPQMDHIRYSQWQKFKLTYFDSTLSRFFHLLKQRGPYDEYYNHFQNIIGIY